jgi:hypothetical protein
MSLTAATLSPLTKSRRSSEGNEPGALTDIYLEDVNIAIWQRELSTEVRESVEIFLKQNPGFQCSLSVSPESAFDSLSSRLGSSGFVSGSNSDNHLANDIAELVDMFCCLFELKQTGLRLTVLDKAMCPKFHVDKVPCRLLTTYQGVATEWLPHNLVNRDLLKPGPLPSSSSTQSANNTLYNDKDIQQLKSGDVALLKGEKWEGNENAGLIHRSPSVDNSQARLLLTLDFM